MMLCLSNATQCMAVCKSCRMPMIVQSGFPIIADTHRYTDVSYTAKHPRHIIDRGAVQKLTTKNTARSVLSCGATVNDRSRKKLYLWHNVSLARAGSHCKRFLDLTQEQGERWVDAQSLCDVTLQHLHVVQCFQTDLCAELAHDTLLLLLRRLQTHFLYIAKRPILGYTDYCSPL